LAVKIRLSRFGRKKLPYYRLVVTDSRAPRDGRYLECVGTYDPLTDPPDVKLVETRIYHWLDRGAQPSDTVRSLLKQKGVLFKRSLKRRGFDDARMDEELKKWDALQAERRRRKSERPKKKKKSKTRAAKDAKAGEAAAAPPPPAESAAAEAKA